MVAITGNEQSHASNEFTGICSDTVGTSTNYVLKRCMCACARRHAVSAADKTGCVRACVQAVKMQTYMLSLLGSGGALYELYGAVLTELDLTAEEQVHYRALQSAADPIPAFCNQWDAMDKPPLNPALLLGVAFDTGREEVRLRQMLQCLPSCFAEHLCIFWFLILSPPEEVGVCIYSNVF